MSIEVLEDAVTYNTRNHQDSDAYLNRFPRRYAFKEHVNDPEDTASSSGQYRKRKLHWCAVIGVLA